MNEADTVNVESGAAADNQDSDTPAAYTVVYTEQLDQMIETQQATFWTSLVLIGLLLVFLIISVLNRYL